MHWILRKCGIGDLTVCTVVEIQMINRISKQFTPPAHTHPESLLTYWGDLWRRMCRLRSQSRRHWSQTEQNASFITGKRTGPFSCSVSDYQCRRECDLKRHMRRHNSGITTFPFHNSTEPTWPCCHIGSVELWNVHYSRYTDTTVCCNLHPSWRRMCILICRLAKWPLT